MPLILTQKLSLNPADSELARRVGDELATFCRGLRCIEVSAEDGTITLSGPVKTYGSSGILVGNAGKREFR
jgi:hypothetical protein